MTVDTLTRLAGDLDQIVRGEVPGNAAARPTIAVREWAKRWLIELAILGVTLPGERD